MDAPSIPKKKTMAPKKQATMTSFFGKKPKEEVADTPGWGKAPAEEDDTDAGRRDRRRGRRRRTRPTTRRGARLHKRRRRRGAEAPVNLGDALRSFGRRASGRAPGHRRRRWRRLPPHPRRVSKTMPCIRAKSGYPGRIFPTAIPRGAERRTKRTLSAGRNAAPRICR